MKNHFMNAKFVGLVSFLLVFLSGCGTKQLSTLRPAGEVGREQFYLMILSIAIMVIVVVAVTFIFLLAVLKSRRSKLGEDFKPKDVAGNHTLEIIWTTIPIILLIILAIPTVYLVFKQADTNAMTADDGGINNEEVIVNVRAYQYWWEFEYPNEDVVTSQELVVPTDTKVYFNLMGADVKHSFWIPAAGGKMDTNVEALNSFYLIFDDDKAQDADRLFYGKCAELCGPSHALMDFKVRALPEEEYDQWLADMMAVDDDSQADTADAEEGQEIFNNSCMGCHSVTPNGAGAMGPNLTNFGDRDFIAGYLNHTEENLKAWIKDPESIKPGNHMTGTYDLSDEEIEKVAAYLMQLNVEEGSGDVSAVQEARQPQTDDEDSDDDSDEEDSDDDSDEDEDDEDEDDEEEGN